MSVDETLTNPKPETRNSKPDLRERAVQRFVAQHAREARFVVFLVVGAFSELCKVDGLATACALVAATIFAGRGLRRRAAGDRVR